MARQVGRLETPRLTIPMRPCEEPVMYWRFLILGSPTAVVSKTFLTRYHAVSMSPKAPSSHGGAQVGWPKSLQRPSPKACRQHPVEASVFAWIRVWGLRLGSSRACFAFLLKTFEFLASLRVLLRVQTPRRCIYCTSAAGLYSAPVTAKAELQRLLLAALLMGQIAPKVYVCKCICIMYRYMCAHIYIYTYAHDAEHHSGVLGLLELLLVLWHA